MRVGEGFFLQIELSKSSGIPNFGVHVIDVDGKLKHNDPVLMTLAADAMEEAVRLMRSRLRGDASPFGVSLNLGNRIAGHA